MIIADKFEMDRERREETERKRERKAVDERNAVASLRAYNYIEWL